MSYLFYITYIKFTHRIKFYKDQVRLSHFERRKKTFQSLFDKRRPWQSSSFITLLQTCQLFFFRSYLYEMFVLSKIFFINFIMPLSSAASRAPVSTEHGSSLWPPTRRPPHDIPANLYAPIEEPMT